MYKEIGAVLAIIITSASCVYQGRIVGGKEVNIASYPFIASLQVMNGKHICGATILNPMWLLTAAHCGFYKDEETKKNIKFSPRIMWVQIGSSNISISAVKPQSIGVKSFYMHENYTNPADSMLFDIALVRVERPMKFGDGVQPVNLPKKRNPSEDLKADGKCIAIGWGTTKPKPKHGAEQTSQPAEANPTSDVLKMVELPLVSMKFCEEKNTLHVEILSHINLCTYSDNTEDACQGDSGGPLMCNGEQWGITSWGDGCAQRDSPNIWTRVDYFLDWIAKGSAETSSGSHFQGHKFVSYATAVLIIVGM